jgi:signal transduction histidine kinase
MLFPALGWANEPMIRLSSPKAAENLGQYVDVLCDSTTILSFAQVRSAAYQTKFVQCTQAVPNFGVTPYPYWLRLRVENMTDVQRWLLHLGYSSISSVQVFVPEPQGTYRHIVTGSAEPFASRPLWHRQIVVPLELPKGVEQVVYLRVTTTVSALVVPLTLHTPATLAEHDYGEQLLNGIIFGVMLVTVLYNAVLWWITREHMYVPYVMYILSIALHIVNLQGFAKQYVWQNLTGFWGQYPYLVFPAVGIAMYALFCYAFFQARVNLPTLRWFFLVIVAALTVFMLLPLIGVPLSLSFGLLSMITLLFPLVALVAGVRVIVRGNSSARYVVTGVSVSLIALFVTVAMGLGMLPFSLWTYYSWPAANTAEIVLLSVALADRITVLRREKEAALLAAKTEELRALEKASEAEIHRLKTVELATANAEISWQNTVLANQAVEIELANTQLQELNVVLERQNAQLHSLDAEKNELMGIVAHDLKNPLNTILNFAIMLREDRADNDQLAAGDKEQYVDSIIRTSERMFELINNLLESNALESGRVHIEQAEIDVAVLAQQSLDSYTHAASAKHITLHYEGEPSVMAFADVTVTVQVLDNLISNAVKFSPHGNNVYVRVTNQNHRVRVEVQDEGPGISEEDMKHLFGKFARLSAQPTGGEHSTGLGLSIVKKLVEAMNGKVWCESELGKGATFIVELPCPQQHNPYEQLV